MEGTVQMNLELLDAMRTSRGRVLAVKVLHEGIHQYW